MTAREKLIDLLKLANAEMKNIPGAFSQWGDFADVLIANGVSLGTEQATSDKVERWCKHILPPKNTPVLGMAKRNPFAKFMPMVVEWVGNGWVCLVNNQYVECILWCSLPDLPKEETT